MNTSQKRGAMLALAAAGALGIGKALEGRRAMDFDGKIVLIFGGSRGLGLVIARELAARGARLAIAARDSQELERAGKELAGLTQVMVVTCDVRDQRQVEEAVRDTVDRFGGLDVLINDAGIIQVGPFEHMTPDDFRDAMATHFWGPLYAVYAALPHLRQSDVRRIVNISSIGGRIAVPHLLPYVASKFALVGFSEGLNAELAREGIVVTTVTPGLMRTGSTYNAHFKGRHQLEFAWFHIANGVPGLSIDAQRAALQIIEACRRGQAELIITPSARVAVLLQALVPETLAWTMRIANRLLPAPTDGQGTTARLGWNSTSRFVPSAMTTLADRATAQNNEV
ncbi:MAG: SDR family NAD(P)-dependent oxidoreductase [Vicinamibacterales bacterium]